MSRLRLHLSVLSAALIVLTGSWFLPAHAAAPPYVALGDSYSSGTGTRSYISDGTSCQRSVYAYPSLIASARGYSLNFRACSGARVSDVTNTQLSALSTATRYVSLSVGGNDIGFTSVLTECAKPSWMSDCNGAIDTAQAYINSTLPSRLSDSLREHQGEGAECEGGHCRLPTALQRRGLQRGHPGSHPPRRRG